MKTLVYIPRTHVKPGIISLNPSPCTVKWEVGTGESLEDGESAGLVYTVENKRLCLRQGGRHGYSQTFDLYSCALVHTHLHVHIHLQAHVYNTYIPQKKKKRVTQLLL